MKTFSLDEANLLLPQIIPLLEKIRIYTRELRVIRVQESINRRSYSADGNMIATPTNEQSSAAQTLKINADTVQFKNEADSSTFLTINSSSGVLSEQNYNATISTNNPSGGSNGDVWYKYS